MTISDELNDALRGERRWRQKLSAAIHDSPSKSETPEVNGAAKIVFAYKQLADVLLLHERAGYE